MCRNFRGFLVAARSIGEAASYASRIRAFSAAVKRRRVAFAGGLRVRERRTGGHCVILFTPSVIKSGRWPQLTLTQRAAQSSVRHEDLKYFFKIFRPLLWFLQDSTCASKVVTAKADPRIARSLAISKASLLRRRSLPKPDSLCNPMYCTAQFR